MKRKVRKGSGSRFTEAQVVELRTRRAAGESLKSLAEAFSTIPEYVSHIATGKIHRRFGGPITRGSKVPMSERELEFDGITLPEREWADRVGLPHALLRIRLSRGWPIEVALGLPLRTAPSQITIPPGPSIAYIDLNDGHAACIDADDVPLVQDKNWYAAKNSKSGRAYPATHILVDGRPECLSLRALILGEKPATAYSVNRNNLDCRRANLRDVSKAQSSWSSAKRSDNKTGFTGVFWSKEKQCFLAKLRTNGVTEHIGSFATIEEAANAVSRAAVRSRGEFARLEPSMPIEPDN